MQRRVLILSALVCIGFGRARGAQPAQVELTWVELGARVTGDKVAFVLPDGTHVEGKVIAVEPDGLRLNVSKSSNRATQPKGKHLVARQDLSVLQVREYRKIGRLLGTTGAVAAAAGVVLAQDIDIYEGSLVVIVPAVVAGGIAGSAVAGYFTGKLFDKKITEIRIVPDRKAHAGVRTPGLRHDAQSQ